MKCHKRLREPDPDSDSDQERKQPAAGKPTDTLVSDKKVVTNGAILSGVKQQKVENWKRSVGMFRGRTGLESLVRKKPVASVTAQQPAAGAQTSTDSDPSKANVTAICSQTPSAQKCSSLTRVVAYSDSVENLSN